MLSITIRACQSGRKLGALAASISLAVAPLSAQGAAIDWAHLNGGMTSNGSVTVKSLNGGTYAATQNPSGAIAKINQNAATQPPTVIVQATSGLAKITNRVSYFAGADTGYVTIGAHFVSGSYSAYGDCNMAVYLNTLRVRIDASGNVELYATNKFVNSGYSGSSPTSQQIKFYYYPVWGGNSTPYASSLWNVANSLAVNGRITLSLSAFLDCGYMTATITNTYVLGIELTPAGVTLHGYQPIPGVGGNYVYSSYIEFLPWAG